MRPRRIALGAPRIVVLSPHLDDAPLSVGALIARAARSGSHVTALTVFAGNPDNDGPAAPWDTACGFASAGDAARGRREEDVRACEILGVEPDWLPFADMDYRPERDADEVWAAVAPKLEGADLVLTPGWPLEHPDHLWLTRLAVERMGPDPRLAFYVEQPYANLRVLGRGFLPGPLLTTATVAARLPAGRRAQQPQPEPPRDPAVPSGVEWIAATAARADRDAKERAILAYPTQLGGLGGDRLCSRIRLYEWGWGGEGIGWTAPSS